MSDSFSLPLRPRLDRPDPPDPLPVEIAQINTQWGSFRHVSEDFLRRRIADQSDDASDDGDESPTEVDTTERLDQLYRKRAEITQFAHQAHMEALFALDFVSLLISQHAPRQAETSMSAYLKQVAPMGSLTPEVVDPPPKPDAVRRDTEAVSRGWRLQNFNSAANKLLNAASRLESEVAAETRYWDEVLSIQNQGWKVCRLPRDRQALGVQYGFLEATPIFRDRGLASLRRADDGSLLLNQGLVPQKARRVRVRVKTADRWTGASRTPLPPTSDADAIEARIRQARDTVYEEELFHEMMREARILAPHGVTTRQNLVRVPVSDEQEVWLDLVDTDGDSPPPADSETTAEDDRLADALSHALRILLAHAHRQNRHRREQAPPPLTPRRRHTPEYHILRPLLAGLQHRAHVRALEAVLGDLHRVRRAAGLPGAGTVTPFASVRPPASRPGVPTVESLVRTLLRPLESTLGGPLAAPQASVHVTVRTSVAGPPGGTVFDLAVHLPAFPDVQPPARISLRSEAEAVLSHVLLLDVVAAIAAAPATPPGRRWEPAAPHHGELITPGGPSAKNRKLTVHLSREALHVEAVAVGGLDPFGRPTPDPTATPRSRTWTAESTGTGLMDFVGEVSQE
ncbi:putative RNA polymerase II mediator complex component SRB4 [Aspergillus campestris IBT 28561]|uniref:Mediator of RNA polymerase II transcription subunit 17 n=1 Tax=Aspergillus campestris (strain IBT 28561) TaxID=1392248 RepID=A0A2I1CXM7_ASPC2|nr:putative RNA polymerase II mediator complex component SRB4 [Aspergillus campestris IBT 28561]PKY02378.1 putative RNA polymerase II mediator complex component SRB4 [Aspergillus campestris IBT 28561]